MSIRFNSNQNPYQFFNQKNEKVKPNTNNIKTSEAEPNDASVLNILDDFKNGRISVETAKECLNKARATNIEITRGTNQEGKTYTTIKCKFNDKEYSETVYGRQVLSTMEALEIRNTQPRINLSSLNDLDLWTDENGFMHISDGYKQKLNEAIAHADEVVQNDKDNPLFANYGKPKK